MDKDTPYWRFPFEPFDGVTAMLPGTTSAQGYQISPGCANHSPAMGFQVSI
jgi:hypothetical protein